MSELQTLPSQELAAQSGEIEMNALPGGLRKDISGVHLGYNFDSQGNARGCVDEVVTLVPEAGIGFSVAQNSLGDTGIYAVPLDGFKVEAGFLDAESSTVAWTDDNYLPDKIRVSYVEGKPLKDTPALELSTTDFGNPGAQVGVIRVTAPDSSVRTFAMAADFEGKQDDWTVHGGIIEVDLTQGQIDGSHAPAIEA